jgi:hypothetical protein
MKLFLTGEPLTQLQDVFIEWLRIYANVYETFSTGYHSILTEEVIENDLFLDAYFVWAKYDREEKQRKQKENEDRLKYSADLKGHADEIDVTVFEKED